MTTYMHKKENVERAWHQYDLKDQVLGRAASGIAKLLIGKHKPTFTPHVDAGDYVVATNAAHVRVTGGKKDKKVYYRHSGYPGGLRQQTLRKAMETDVTKVIRQAVKGMLPKNKHQQPRLRRLKVYEGEQHPHANHFQEKK